MAACQNYGRTLLKGLLAGAPGRNALGACSCATTFPSPHCLVACRSPASANSPLRIPPAAASLAFNCGARGTVATCAVARPWDRHPSAPGPFQLAGPAGGTAHLGAARWDSTSDLRLRAAPLALQRLRLCCRLAAYTLISCTTQARAGAAPS